uniref:GH84 domain-containing protein n=1 Tax=Ictidomys tridecemlineatus TaxID=43179 RepID=A0A287CV58_ICTTR
MVQKESQAALEERENELSSNPAASAGASLEPPAAPAPGEDNPGTGAGGAAVTGAAGGARRFLCGVVEGFYGRPWVMEQRKELFRRLQKWELNTYLYAPKDDYKHRMFWREMYSVEEAEQLMTLISAAREYEIEFIYAISPGLDITFSNPKEVSTLKRKLDQVIPYFFFFFSGLVSFALLFDDIDHNMCAADKEVFSSFAHAQVSITNEIYQYLGEPETFLFCPTEYCGTFCYPNVSQSPYLRTVANYVAIHTLATWYKSNMNGVRKDVVMTDSEDSTVSIQIKTILYDMYSYVWDIKSIMSMVKSFVQWLGCRSHSSAQFLIGDQEPWAFRGGLAGEFQRLLPIDGANDLFFQPPPLTPTSKVYTIRPYFPKDEASVYKICREMYDDGVGLPFQSQPDLIGDKLVGGLLSLSLDYCFVLEDEDGICGYALGTVDVTPFIKKCKISWIPFMQEKYTKPNGDKELSEAEKIMLSFHEEQEVLPETFLANFPSLIKMDIHKKVTDPSVAKSMMACLLSSLKANGSRGAFCEVRPDDKRILEFYSKLGCFEIAKMEGFPKDVVILGRSL